MIEKAAGLWGKAGQRSLERSALVEAAEQLSRALDQIATLPATPALRNDRSDFRSPLYTPSSRSEDSLHQKPKQPRSKHAC